MKVNIELDCDQMDDIVLESLKESLYMVLDSYGEIEHDTIYGLLQAINFYMTYDDREKFLSELMENYTYFNEYDIKLVIEAKE